MTTQSTYQSLIDGIVDVSRLNVTGDRIRANGHEERINIRDLPLSPEEQARKALLQSLDRSAREMIISMLADERQAAVHDVLAELDRSVAAGEIDIVADGVSLSEAADGSLHFDFMTRCADDPWPGAD